MHRDVSELATIHKGCWVDFFDGSVDASMCDGFTEMLRDAAAGVDVDVIVSGVISHGDNNSIFFDYSLSLSLASDGGLC